MKLKWKFIWILTMAIVLVTVRWIYEIIETWPQESFTAILDDEELNAREEDFVKLAHYSSNKFNVKEEESHMIHFLEGYGHSSLSARVWCAVEAACSLNAQATVVLHMRSHRLLMTSAADAVMRRAANLRVVALDEENLFKESPLKLWYRDRKWEQSRWPMSHYNDALRWLLLYHYGGVYLDLDCLSVRPLTPPELLVPNFAGLESLDWVGAGAIGVSGPHHWLPEACLQAMAEHFDGSEWGSNGPKLLTRILEKRCGLVVPFTRTPRCGDFTVLPLQTFYPIPWWKHHLYTDPDENSYISSTLLANPEARVIHIWQHLTKNVAISLNNNNTLLLNDTSDKRAGDLNILPTNKLGQHFKSSNPQESTKDSGDNIVPGERAAANGGNTLGRNHGNPRQTAPQPIAVIARRVCPATVASLAGGLL